MLLLSKHLISPLGSWIGMRKLRRQLAPNVACSPVPTLKNNDTAQLMACLLSSRSPCTHNVYTSNRIQDPNDPCHQKHHYEPVSSKISGIVLLPDMNSLCEVNNKHAFLKIEHLSPDH